MIEVSEAVKIINETQLHLSVVKIPIEKAMGRVLRQEIVADNDFPPFNRVMMDGIAIRHADYAKGKRVFRIQGIQPAGAEQLELRDSGDCLEVMTGAVAPRGTDTVIPYEDIEISKKEGVAQILVEVNAKGKNIHRQGTDKLKGDVLVGPGVMMGSPEIAIAASVGQNFIEVSKNPTIAIISTGNELVDITEKPLPHQIRKSNVYALLAELNNLGLNAGLFHLSDQAEEMKDVLAEIMENHDVLLMSGGVSKGKFDFVPEVLKELGVQKRFHRVKQKPGKPLWFGVKEGKNVVFAFPGNPVSTFVCFHKYFVPWLMKNLGLEGKSRWRAILGQDFNIKTSLTYFLQVAASVDPEGILIANPVVGKGSGDHANLLSSNAFLEMPASTFQFRKGEVFELIPFRDMYTIKHK